MKTLVNAAFTVTIVLERGEWTIRNDAWSIASVSFTIRKRADGTWGTRIDHADFKAWERRWTIKDRVVFSADRKFPGFYPKRDEIPANVMALLWETYILANSFPNGLPPLDEGRWSPA